MRSVGIIAVILIICASLAGWAQCSNCGAPDEPDCYLAFKTTETIEFSLIAPIDWFELHGKTESPHIFGWRVEASDGTVVRTVIYPGEPRSRLTIMEWDLYDEAGYIVPPGDYQIIVMTTESDVSYPVRIVDACQSWCGCYVPPTCDIPCCIRIGELYLSLSVGETRSCGGLSFSLTIHVEYSSP
ncbi:hypothetical protein KAR02_08995 [Candidatus Bipolaricaulota bacterium]|nr:hypothetical protein [Candidatus Bipolaricaulota bacterium]